MMGQFSHPMKSTAYHFEFTNDSQLMRRQGARVNPPCRHVQQRFAA
jgi:hypothetical protein